MKNKNFSYEILDVETFKEKFFDLSEEKQFVRQMRKKINFTKPQP